MHTRVFPYIIVSMLWIFFSFSIYFFFSEDTVMILTDEDGFYETSGALFFLFAAILYFFLYLKSKPGNIFYTIKTDRNIFFFLLGLLFFFGFAEEISWGQRIFNIQTPELLEEVNMQNEFNVHNLEIFHGNTASGERKEGLALLLTMDKMFSLFWLGFCIFVPVLCKSSTKVLSWIKKINIPLVPLSLGICFFVNYILSKITEIYIERFSHDNSIVQGYTIVEVKEGNFALLFFILAVWFTLNIKEHNKNYTH